MKKRLSLFLLTVGFLTNVALVASEYPKNVYNGTVITKDNLYKLGVLLDPKGHKKLRSIVGNYYQKNQDEFKKIIVRGNASGVKNNETNSCNIVRPCFDDTYVEKVSGVHNRFELQVAAQHLPYGHTWKLDKSKLRKETEQTASRMFGHLSVLESIKQNDLKCISRPKSYLVDVTGGQSIRDTKCAFYEETLPSTYKLLSTFLKDQKLLEQALPIKAFKEILIICRGMGTGGGWNLNGANLYIDEKTDTIVPIDTEQPNTTKPAQLFNCDWDTKDPRVSRYLHAVVAGLMGLYDIFGGLGNYRKEIEQFVKNDNRIQGAMNFKELTAKFPKK